MKIFRLILLSFTVLGSAANAKYPDNFDEALSVIAFGSCNRDELPQTLWPTIAKNDPDLWIWAGDNIYADWYRPPSGEKVKYTINRDWMTRRYIAQFTNPAYSAFREKTSVIGTWDDHDYGLNNAGAEFDLKEISRDLALSFLEVPLSDPRWARPGLYGSYDFGPEGQRTRIILIDNRYFMTPDDAEEATMLGPVQKQWLEDQIRNSDAELHLIVSGIQFLSNEHRWDTWGKYPRERTWLLNLIKETGKRVVFISGDRHIHEISIKESDAFPHVVADITSSGMTHSWESFPGEPNPYRFGEVYNGKGFGLIRIDWSGDAPSLTLEIRDTENAVRNRKRINY
jgi:alkaline phosphatase D